MIHNSYSMSNFQQTVDLREERERQRRAATRKAAAAPLEKIYRPEVEPDLKTISRPKVRQSRDWLIKLIIFVLAIFLVGVTVYFLFFKTNSAATSPNKTNDWYAVKLVSGEIFYGQVLDVKADPVVIDNVYYNYDQAKEKEGAKSVQETGNLRLVKRGQETHGPAGSMNIVRSQVLYLEALKSDSKALKAILEYEK